MKTIKQAQRVRVGDTFLGEIIVAKMSYLDYGNFGSEKKSIHLYYEGDNQNEKQGNDRLEHFTFSGEAIVLIEERNENDYAKSNT